MDLMENAVNAFSWKLIRRLQGPEFKSERLSSVINTELSQPFDPANMLGIDVFVFFCFLLRTDFLFRANSLWVPFHAILKLV